MLQQSPMYAYIPAADLDRARRFYEGKLGFVPKEETNGAKAAWFKDSEGNIMALIQSL